MRHTLVTLVRDRPGVLNRTASIFRRWRLNIETLSVTKTTQPGVSRITWVVDTDDISPLVAQLEKLIDVLEVHETSELRVVPSNHTPTSLLALTQADGNA